MNLAVFFPDYISKTLTVKMPVNLKFFWIVLICLVSLTTGCVYLRLLQVKRQLSAFNSYFRIEDQNELSLVFLKPVLSTNDITWLMSSAPMSREETGSGELWEYVMEKQYRGSNNEEGSFDIPMSMLFIGDKLSQISFSERFLEYLSKPLLAKMLASMGKAEIDKADRRAGSRFQAKDSVEIPREKQVMEVLGKPYSTKESGNTKSLIYAYDLKMNSSDSRSNGFILIMTFKFRKEDDGLKKAEINLRGLKMSLDFSLDQRESE